MVFLTWLVLWFSHPKRRPKGNDLLTGTSVRRGGPDPMDAASAETCVRRGPVTSSQVLVKLGAMSHDFFGMVKL